MIIAAEMESKPRLDHQIRMIDSLIDAMQSDPLRNRPNNDAPLMMKYSHDSGKIPNRRPTPAAVERAILSFCIVSASGTRFAGFRL
jgi:hypothetical protein